MGAAAGGPLRHRAPTRRDGARPRCQDRRPGSDHRGRCDGWVRPRDSRSGARPQEDGSLHPFRPRRCRRGDRAGRLVADHRRGARAHRDDHRQRHRWAAAHRRRRPHRRHQGPAPALAVHRAVVPGQSRRRPSVDPARVQGSARLAGHGLRGGRPGDRRRGAADPLRRGGCRDLRRRGIDDRPRGIGLLRRLACPIHRLQRRAVERLAPVRSGARRIRDGRRRRYSSHRGAGARPRPRGHAARRDRRLRHQRGCLPHHLGPGGRERPPRAP